MWSDRNRKSGKTTLGQKLCRPSLFTCSLRIVLFEYSKLDHTLCLTIPKLSSNAHGKNLLLNTDDLTQIFATKIIQWPISNDRSPKSINSAWNRYQN